VTPVFIHTPMISFQVLVVENIHHRVTKANKGKMKR